MIRFSPSLLALAPLLWTLAITGTSWAQPDVDNGPKAENPANRAPRAGRRDKAQMTQQDMLQKRMSREFKVMGITDAAQQQALSTYIQGEATARELLVDKGRTLSQALRAATLTDAQALGLLNTYNAAVDDNKARHDKALTTLQKSVAIAKNPKVEAYLTLLGFYGDGPAVINSLKSRDRGNFRGATAAVRG